MAKTTVSALSGESILGPQRQSNEIRPPVRVSALSGESILGPLDNPDRATP